MNRAQTRCAVAINRNPSALRNFFNKEQSRLRKAGLSGEALRALEKIIMTSRPNRTVSLNGARLGRYLGVSRQAGARWLRKLEAYGLLIRTRIGTFVFLTRETIAELSEKYVSYWSDNFQKSADLKVIPDVNPAFTSLETKNRNSYSSDVSPSQASGSTDWAALLGVSAAEVAASGRK